MVTLQAGTGEHAQRDGSLRQRVYLSPSCRPSNPSPRPRKSRDAIPTKFNSRRLMSVDIFRRLAVAGMILVDNPDSDDKADWPIQHTQWNGWTPADLIFPSFDWNLIGSPTGDVRMVAGGGFEPPTFGL